jgi:hypothetical protein
MPALCVVEAYRALLANWVGAASALLRPLVDAIRRHALAVCRTGW